MIISFIFITLLLLKIQNTNDDLRGPLSLVVGATACAPMRADQAVVRIVRNARNAACEVGTEMNSHLTHFVGSG